MKDIYEKPKEQKKTPSRGSKVFRYCIDCFNNPISWIIGPTFVGYASIISGAMQVGYDVQHAFATGQSYQDSLYKIAQNFLERTVTPDSFAGLAGFFLGGKIWRFLRGDKK